MYKNIKLRKLQKHEKEPKEEKTQNIKKKIRPEGTSLDQPTSTFL